MLLLVFLTDYAKIALATDHVRWSRRPETWRLTGHVRVAVILGVVMVIEACGLLAIGWRAFDLVADDEALHTFTFQTLFSGLAPLPRAETLIILSYATICSLFVNDLLKVALMKRVGLQS